MSETKISEHRRRSKREWLDKNMESMSVSLKPGTKEIWKDYATQSGLSLVGFLQTAVEEKAERDGLKTKKEQS